MSARDALLKYHERMITPVTRTHRKNKKPEKEVEKQVMAWLEQNDFSCHVVESKAVYNYQAGRYLKGQTVSGMPDVIGVTPDGIGCFIELKAPGRRSRLREAQREFLETKIRRGAFSLCVDSVGYLSSAYDNWLQISKDNREHFLRGLLPSKRVRNEEDHESFDL